MCCTTVCFPYLIGPHNCSDCLDSNFKAAFRFKYEPAKPSSLKFSVFKCASGAETDYSQPIAAFTPYGAGEIAVSDLMEAPGSMASVDLAHEGSAVPGKLAVRFAQYMATSLRHSLMSKLLHGSASWCLTALAFVHSRLLLLVQLTAVETEGPTVMAGVASLRLACKDLPSIGGEAPSAYVQLQRQGKDGSWQHVWSTEPVRGEANPTFEEATVPLLLLCGGKDAGKPIIVELHQWGSDEAIACAQTSVKDLVALSGLGASAGISLQHPDTGDAAGTLWVVSASTGPFDMKATTAHLPPAEGAASGDAAPAAGGAGAAAAAPAAAPGAAARTAEAAAPAKAPAAAAAPAKAPAAAAAKPTVTAAKPAASESPVKSSAAPVSAVSKLAPAAASGGGDAAKPSPSRFPFAAKAAGAAGGAGATGAAAAPAASPAAKPAAAAATVAAAAASPKTAPAAAASPSVAPGTTFDYETLKAAKPDVPGPCLGIDFASKELLLSDADFARVFGVARDAFAALPKWKRDAEKKRVGLF